MTYKKSKGLNASEGILVELGERSFLSLWSHPNLSRSPGTELCDLLVVFENRVLIFSDKLSEFQNKKDIKVSWFRWKKKAIDQSIKSVEGTQRWIKEYPERVFLDAACKQPFPFDLNRNDLIFHKFVVANGTPEDLSIKYCKNTPQQNDDIFHLNLNNTDIVHVLNDHNLSLILEELDTITDFCDYFLEKEKIILGRDKLFYQSETDLLAHYFMKIDEREERHKIHFSKDKYGNEFIQKGAWNIYTSHHQYLLKKQEDEISYLWDETVSYLARNTLNNTMEFSNCDPYEGKGSLHVMAKECRFSRRILGKHIFEALNEFSPELGTRHIRRMQSNSDVQYVFLQVAPHKLEDIHSIRYRDLRREMLLIACGTLKIKMDVEQDERFDQFNKILGIATAPPKLSGRTNSQDFILLDLKDIDEEFEQYCLEENKKYNFWKQASLRESEVRIENEYPKLRDEVIVNFGGFKLSLDEE